MTRFTIKGWIQLPFVILFRAPFALLAAGFEFLGSLFNALANRCDQLMRLMPAPEYNPGWFEAEQERQMKEVRERLTSGSQRG